MSFSKRIVVGTTVSILPLLIILLCIFIVFLVPFLFIWAVNLLFETQIEYSFWNSVAVYVLIGLLNGRSSCSSN